jgi:hypothetical protein
MKYTHVVYATVIILFLLFQAQAKFSLERGIECITWIEDMIGAQLEVPEHGIRDQLDFAFALKDGSALCQ